MKGHPTSSGYMGYFPGKGYILFSSEDDYEEYYMEVTETCTEQYTEVA